MTQPEKPETDVDKTAKLNSSVDVEDTASANGSRDDDLELSTPPPPWQRFKQDTAKVNAEQATVEQVTPPAPAEQPTQGVGESTVHLDHPVVTVTLEGSRGPMRVTGMLDDPPKEPLRVIWTSPPISSNNAGIRFTNSNSPE